jgi:undecaprenyl-diphosphatase
LVVAVVQGITEFLPISSSGHLVAVPALTGWPDQGGVIDVAVHVGTLVAVVLYFRRDLAAMVMGLARARRKDGDPGARLLAYLVLATVPVVIAGGLVEWWGLREQVRGIEVVAWATIVFGLVLYVADRVGMKLRQLEHLTAGAAVTIGLAQVLALIPGTSRAGITVTAARALGFERRDAARFSMLLSIPTIAAAGTLGAIEIYRSGNSMLGLDALLAAAFSCLAALVAIALLMAWLRHASFTPFVIYRVAVGTALLVWAYA